MTRRAREWVILRRELLPVTMVVAQTGRAPRPPSWRIAREEAEATERLQAKGIVRIDGEIATFTVAFWTIMAARGFVLPQGETP